MLCVALRLREREEMTGTIVCPHCGKGTRKVTIADEEVMDLLRSIREELVGLKGRMDTEEARGRYMILAHKYVRLCEKYLPEGMSRKEIIGKLGEMMK